MTDENPIICIMPDCTREAVDGTMCKSCRGTARLLNDLTFDTDLKLNKPASRYVSEWERTSHYNPVPAEKPASPVMVALGVVGVCVMIWLSVTVILLVGGAK